MTISHRSIQMDLRNLVPKEEQVKPLVKREIAIKLEYIDPEGMKHNASILSRVPDGDGRLKIDRQVALLAGGLWSGFSPYSQARIEALAQLSVQLIHAPEWLNKWIVEDDELLFSLFEEVKKHNSLFFRSGLGQGEGVETVQRVVIDSKDTTQNIPK